MNELILIRYGDLVLKGRNQKYFIKLVNDLIKEKLSGLAVGFDFRHDRAYVILDGVSHLEVISRLQYVTGLYSYSLVSKCDLDYEIIATTAIDMINEKIGDRETSFKVETKRADKTITETSMEISKLVSRKVLFRMPNLKVDVHNPDTILHIEARNDGAYLFLDQVMGTGGFPVPVGGKALVLLSGGIDSPVAAYLAMKKGIEVECVHFESTPLTSIESVQKVIDIARILARYLPGNRIRLHLVPFTNIHERLLTEVPEAYLITLMRRMMVRIANGILKETEALAIITGDSIGQVASQTLESLRAIQNVTDQVIIRPLASYDKVDIMALAKKLGTIEISNRPFSDCCAVYVPKSPVIRPEISRAEKYEEKLEYMPMVKQAIADRKTITIAADDALDIRSLGLTVAEAFK